MDRETMDIARAHWDQGKCIDAGRVLFENVPHDLRPRWAAKILRLFLRTCEVDFAPFDELFKTVGNRLRWGNCHRVFDIIRKQTLALDEKKRTGSLTERETIFHRALLLGELVAKVTYNESRPLDPFDEDSGWYLVAYMKSCVALKPNSGLERVAWSLLVDEVVEGS